MPCKHWLSISLFLALAAHCPAALANEAPNELFGGQNVSALVELLEDPGGRMGLAEILAPAGQAGFRPIEGDRIEIGFSDSAWWGRLKIPPDAAGRPFDLLEFTKPALSHIDVYFPIDETPHAPPRWRKVSGGEFVPASQRPIAFRCPVFAIAPDTPPGALIYFRVKSLVSINTKLVCWRTADFLGATFYDNMAFGAIYGALLAMGLYNLILFLSLRDKVYLFYVAYDFSIICYLASVYGHIAFLPHAATLLGPSTYLILSAVGLIAGILFVRAFLSIRDTSSAWDILTKLAVLIVCLSLSPALWGDHNLGNRALNLVALVIGLLFLCLASDYLRRGYRPALYLVIAWGGFMLGVCLFTLGGVVIPRTPLTVYMLPLGAVLDAVLLSFALADRIRSLQTERADLAKSRSHFMELASRDSLTGLYNRRHAFDHLRRMLAEHQQQARPLSLLMLDVDDFKTFNDTFGHPEGDKVLVGLAAAICQGVRARDVACRYGGEEFMVVLPDSSNADAIKAAERIRVAFEQTRFNPGGFRPLSVTISIGAASLTGAGDNLEALVGRADQALYAAKAGGKNRTITFDDLPR